VVGLPRGVIDGSHAPTPSLVALILNGQQGNRSASGVLQVSLTELHEGLVGSPLQRVIQVISCGRSSPNRQARV
jgi:hypothetical protein